MFQVVPPCGGHPGQYDVVDLLASVSSRAPVWGASSSWFLLPLVSSSFKSCPRVGGIPITPHTAMPTALALEAGFPRPSAWEAWPSLVRSRK